MDLWDFLHSGWDNICMFFLVLFIILGGIWLLFNITPMGIVIMLLLLILLK